MIDNIAELSTIKNQITAEFGRACEHLSDLLKSEHEATAHVLFMYMGTTTSLLDSIFLCERGDNYYGMCILYRSLLEHFLRFQFFFINLAKNQKDDTYSWRFVMTMDFYEKLELAKARNIARRIKTNEEKTYAEIWTNLQESRDEFKNFTKHEISEFSKNLSIKNIISFITSSMETQPNEDHFLHDRIEQYSQLSSFVHGGLFAHKEAVRVEMLDNRYDSYLDICKWALEITTSIKILSYVSISQYVPDFELYLRKTEEHMNKYRPIKRNLKIRYNRHNNTFY